MKAKKVFSSKEIEAAVGLKMNTLHYYINAGAITPDVDEGRGYGHKRLFSSTNFTEVIIIRRLMDMGLPQSRITVMMKSINAAGDRSRLDPMKYLHAWTAGGQFRRDYIVFLPAGKKYDHVFITGQDSLASFMETNPVALVVDLYNAIANVFILQME
jgi:DNA-binding transcriptional MerR regulator